MSLRQRLTAPTKTGVTAAKVATDVTTYGGVIVSILTILANVPGLSSVFHATGAVQGVVDAAVAVVTAIFSVRAQQTTVAAVSVATTKASRKR